MSFQSGFYFCIGEGEKDAFSFEFIFNLNEDGSCHVTVNETITFNEHYVGNPDLMIDFGADKMDAGDGGGFFGSSGSGSGGQKFQTSGGKYRLLEYIHYIILTEYSPSNFTATDKKTGDRLEVTERSLGDYIDFIIEIKGYIGSPEKGDVYRFMFEYDTKNRVEFIETGRYTFNFYRKGEGKEGLNEFTISVRLPPDYEYETSRETNPTHVFQAGRTTIVKYEGEYEMDSKFHFEMQYHYPVAVFVEEGKELMEKGEYSLAQQKLKEAERRYSTLENTVKVNEVSALILQCEKLVEADEIFDTAKRNYLNGEFNYSKEWFEQLLSEYGTFLTSEMQQESRQYLDLCMLYVDAQRYEQQALDDMNKEKWESARTNLYNAREIYQQLNEDEKVQSLDKELLSLNETIESEKKKSIKETLGSQLTSFIIGSVAVVGGLVLAFYGFNMHKKRVTPKKEKKDTVSHKIKTKKDLDVLRSELDEDYIEDRITREEYLRRKEELEGK